MPKLLLSLVALRRTNKHVSSWSRSRDIACSFRSFLVCGCSSVWIRDFEVTVGFGRNHNEITPYISLHVFRRRKFVFVQINEPEFISLPRSYPTSFPLHSTSLFPHGFRRAPGIVDTKEVCRRIRPSAHWDLAAQTPYFALFMPMPMKRRGEEYPHSRRDVGICGRINYHVKGADNTRLTMQKNCS